MPKDWLVIPEARYVATINEPFTIDLKTFSIACGWCNNLDLDNQIENGPTVNASGIHFSNITDEMSTLWNCVLTLDQGWDPFAKVLQINTTNSVFPFHLHVKGAKTVKVTVNNTELSFVRANLSEPYDGEAEYFFKEDETVDVFCINKFSKGSVHIKYITKGFSYADPKNVTHNSKFTIKLTSEYVNSSFQCVYTSEFNETYVYKISFLPKHTDESSIANYIRKITNNPDKSSTFLIVGCSVGAAILVLILIGVGCYFKRHGNVKNEHSKQEDLYTIYDTPAPDYINTYVNDKADCQYVNEGFHNAPVSENIYNDRQSNVYAEVNYDTCKPKTNVSQTRYSVVYDAPYGRISVIRAHHRQS